MLLDSWEKLRRTADVCIDSARHRQQEIMSEHAREEWMTGWSEKQTSGQRKRVVFLTALSLELHLAIFFWATNGSLVKESWSSSPWAGLVKKSALQGKLHEGWAPVFVTVNSLELHACMPQDITARRGQIALWPCIIYLQECKPPTVRSHYSCSLAIFYSVLRTLHYIPHCYRFKGTIHTRFQSQINADSFIGWE